MTSGKGKTVARDKRSVVARSWECGRVCLESRSVKDFGGNDVMVSVVVTWSCAFARLRAQNCELKKVNVSIGKFKNWNYVPRIWKKRGDRGREIERVEQWTPKRLPIFLKSSMTQKSVKIRQNAPEMELYIMSPSASGFFYSLFSLWYSPMLPCRALVHLCLLWYRIRPHAHITLYPFW